jgi:hypothetical protein
VGRQDGREQGERGLGGGFERRVDGEVEKQLEVRSKRWLSVGYVDTGF